MTRLLAHVRQNLVAYLALFVALGGTSYAAFTISGSQIQNRSIDAVKLNPQSIAASIRAWAFVESDGSHVKATATSSRVQVSTTGPGERITWPHRRFGRNCLPSVTSQLTPPSGSFGSVTVVFTPGDGSLLINGFGPDRVGRPQSAYVMIICP